MPKSLRTILGKSSRVTKPSRPAAPKRQPSSPSSPSPRKARDTKKDDGDQYMEKLEDLGLDQLAADLNTRDVVQAMRYIRQRMFTAVPSTGLNSTRTAEILNYRLKVPPLVLPSHLNAILHSPTVVEREIVELMGKGILRKTKVDRGAGLGEALIEISDLEDMLRKTDLTTETKEKFVEFLKANTASAVLPKGILTPSEEDSLVRAGFLTYSSLGNAVGDTLRLRPEDRATLMSLQNVAQFASGTVSAVGGQNVIHMAGGGGGAPTLTRSSSSSVSASAREGGTRGLRIAVPGHGPFLKLAGGVLNWLREALKRTRWREAPEEWLRERFEGGGLYGTRWKEFWGVEWDWVIGLAVGLGTVEVFSTKSVGRGVRLLNE
ncbi:hypothetical protein HJFPF1_01028 [Paramyrothecium foliicola]|nr:hypothetical protein HJFPF1_01028 [Paramyrothecium foliicola]